MSTARRLEQALWRLYNRPEHPHPWAGGGNLPWNDPAFSERMLREHLDESHGAASRVAAERALILDWLWQELALRPGSRVLDFTCGPGLYAVPLAERGCHVIGIDFSPAAIAYARELAAAAGVAAQCHFIEQDVRQWDPAGATFDAALFLYGQLAVFPRPEAQALLTKTATALRPAGRLCIELLDQERVDKADSTWWFTGESGLWGDAPFLCLGERHWYAAEQLSLERYYVLHLQTGRMDEITLADQTYSTTEMAEMLHTAGFSHTAIHPQWAGLPLYDAPEWVVYVGEVESHGEGTRQMDEAQALEADYAWSRESLHKR